MNGSEFFDYSLPVRTASNSLHFGANFIRLSLKEKKLTFTTYFAIGLNIKIWITFERIRIFRLFITSKNSFKFSAFWCKFHSSIFERKKVDFYHVLFCILVQISFVYLWKKKKLLNIKIWITFERIRIFRLFITSKNSFKFSAFWCKFHSSIFERKKVDFYHVFCDRAKY